MGVVYVVRLRIVFSKGALQKRGSMEPMEPPLDPPLLCPSIGDVLATPLLPLQLGMAICYQDESAYFPAPYLDNQLICSLCDPKRSRAFNSAGFKHNN